MTKKEKRKRQKSQAFKEEEKNNFYEKRKLIQKDWFTYNTTKSYHKIKKE